MNFFFSSFQRARKERKLYSDEWALGDDEIDGNISVFNIADKVDDPLFSQNFVKEMNGPGKSFLQLRGPTVRMCRMMRGRRETC